LSQIEIQNVSKTYKIDGMDIRALDNISLRIEKAEFISIIGHSGSGKTTLLSIIGGILRQSSGCVMFNGTNICCLDENGLSRYRADKIGYIFQFASLLPVLTVKENLLLPAIFSSEGLSRDRRKMAEEYLSMVGLQDKMNVYPSQLSGGQQRRVAIVRALMNEPEVILADEPTGDLDEETERDIISLLKNINMEKRITLILVTHNCELSKEATRRLIMGHGRIQEL